MTFAEELMLILEKEMNILVELKELSFRKTDIIIDNLINDLEELTRKEEILINKIGTLEEEREKLLDTWGLAVNTPISSIIEKLPEDNEELIDITDKMHNIMEELSFRNKLNNDIIRENLDWIDFNMNLITSAHMEPGYGNESKKSSRNNIFDRKV
ncbi:flagellar protein FlgN [Tissierella praeacuta]|uniref:FlgN protein n=1 Tax=Tissierella praeacuta DSM 18095 TaxID=1123404 RepID=A0A1M4X183_9FIRM|nr:flagellar protein FlgN [Tissierella praeacuta]MBU5255684.1 flagellar protein FlgN [Tissierella praeacuta]TCU79033.1 FlgN protein [Tissierella praeacuta]SHE87256.1 FlgN protein [Tissierella praeacuta DSM 18095]SUO99624.1 FlgN protein [Tissierella praeacuta]